MSTSATCELLNEYFTNISGMPSDLDMNALLSELPEYEYLTVNIGQVMAQEHRYQQDHLQ